MSRKKLQALSLFSGAGGMDIGVIQAGFRILASIELDPHACDTLRSNISRERRRTRVIEEDIRKIDPEKLMIELNIKPGELDLLFGGPPCQAFSQIGKRHSLNDERGLLIFEMIRFAEVFQPRSILIEQVKGLLNAPDQNGTNGGVFEQVLNCLEKLNYVPKWKIINSADYGVPQLRQRVFIISTKKPNGFIFPQATHCPHDKVSPLFSLITYATVGDALRGLGKPQKQNGIIPENSHLDVTTDGDIYRINGVPEGSHLSAQVHLPIQQRGRLSKKDTTKFKRLSRNQPSNTLRCGEIFFHPTENRYLTPREYMRIHGYPDSYLLKGPIRSRSGTVRNLDQHRLVANSVPPPIAFILAKAIIKVLNAKNI